MSDTRHGRPIAVIIPIMNARSWALSNRTLRAPEDDADTAVALEWIDYGFVRLSVEAADRYDTLSPSQQARAHRELGLLRRLHAHGRLVIRIGLLWALVDLEDRDVAPAVIAIAERHELDRWLWAGEQESIRATAAIARHEGWRDNLDD